MNKIARIKAYTGVMTEVGQLRRQRRIERCTRKQYKETDLRSMALVHVQFDTCVHDV